MTKTSTALDRVAARPLQTMSLEETREWATIFANSGMVPRALTNKPEAVMLVAAMGAELGISFVMSIKSIDVIDNKPQPNAQTLLGFIRAQGNEARFTATTPTRAVLRARRRENRSDPKAWCEVEWTEEMARTAGELDEWVEHKYKLPGDRYDRTERFFLRRDGNQYVPVELGAEIPDWAQSEIKAAKVRRKDPWWKRRQNMLRAACIRDMFRMEFSDLFLGGRFAVDIDDLSSGLYVESSEDLGETSTSLADDEDDDIVDGEIVGDGGNPGGRPVDGGDPVDSGGEVGSSPASVATAAHAPDGPGGENGEAPVVEASTVPCPADGEAWRALCREHGVSQAALLRRAREAADSAGITPPGSLDDLAEVEDLAQELATWVAAGGKA